MRIIYFGFDLFYDCFKSIAGRKDIEVMALYTFKTDNKFEFNKDVIALAKEKNIEIHTEKITEEALKSWFNKGCELTVSAGYIYKIPILKRDNFKGINIHPALLPIGRGAWPYPVTILKGLKEDGITVHKISKGFDEGDILLQESFCVSKDETLDTLTKKSQMLAAKLINKCFDNFSFYWQNAAKQGVGEYWKEPTDLDRTITDNMTLSEARLIVRAFGSFGVIYNGCEYFGKGKRKTVKLKDGEIIL